MPLEKFDTIYHRAAERKGGTEQLENLIKQPKTAQALAAIPDDRWLSNFTMKVFQCGISWDLVVKKWPAFENHFFQFNVDTLQMLSPEQWETKAKDPVIIRDLTKVMSIPANAQMIIEARQTHGSFGDMIAQWPAEDITGLWDHLKKHGKRLGGNTGPYALQAIGVDTFIFSSDVEEYLRDINVIDTGRNTKRAKQAATHAFLQWQEESGRSFAEISQTIAYSRGINKVE